MTTRDHMPWVPPSEPARPRPRRPAFNPDVVRSGVDLCVAALARVKAVRSGVDPDEAADIAEGEAAVRRVVLSIRCPHCNAPASRPCVRVGSGSGDGAGPLRGYHDSRVGAAHSISIELEDA